MTLALPPGSTLVVLGPNGAGKTTLLRVLATLLRPHAGSARVLGHDLPGQVAKKGEYFERKLHSLADRHPMVTEVRGKGLIWALELDRPVAEEMMGACSEEGLLVNNVKPTALRFIPPLTVSEEEIDGAIEIVDRVLARFEAGGPK